MISGLEWDSGRLSPQGLQRILESVRGHDFVTVSKPITEYDMPGVQISSVVQRGAGNWHATGILSPCNHPIQLRAATYDALQYQLMRGLPVRCRYCMEAS